MNVLLDIYYSCDERIIQYYCAPKTPLEPKNAVAEIRLQGFELRGCYYCYRINRIYFLRDSRIEKKKKVRRTKHTHNYLLRSLCLGLDAAIHIRSLGFFLLLIISSETHI